MKITLFIIFLLLHSIIYGQSGWYSKNPLPQNNIYSIKFFNATTGLGFCNNGIVIRTTNSGYSWQNITTGTSKSIFASFFINNNTGYAAGDSGVILKTLDGGSNWIILNSGVNNALREIFFTDNNTGFITGSNGLVLRTTNAGINWTQSILTTKNLKTIFFTSVNTGYAGGDTTFLFKTTNAGLNWNIQFTASNYIKDIYFIDASIGIIKTPSNVLRTSDGGDTWQQTMGGLLGVQNSSIDFLNSTTGYIASDNSQLLKTTNGGINWYGFGPTNIYPQFNIYSIDVLDSSNIFLSGNDGFVFKTQVSSAGWENIGGNAKHYNYFTFTNDSIGYINSGNFILSTTNGGDKWNIYATGLNNWFEPTFIEFKKIVSRGNKMVRIMRVSGGGGPNFSESVSYSTDGGQTWPYSLGSTFVYAVDAALADDYGVGLFFSGTYLLRRIDNGNTLYSSASQLLKVAFHNNNIGVIVTPNSLIRTTNAGQNWNKQPLLVNNIPNSIQLQPSGKGIILCDTTTILGTENFGTTWTVRYSNSSIKFRTVNMYSDDIGYGISTSNLFVNTTNGGLNWFQHQTGNTKRLNAVHFVNLNTGYIVGDSGTVLKTTDGGLTFINQTGELYPDNYSLSQNYPNPFNPVTNIKFDIPKSGFVKIVIYDLLGREITQLVNQQMQPGSYSVDWDGSSYPSGVYFYKLVIGDNTNNGGFIETKKMVLIK